MAGHNKWTQIKRQKEVVDAKKSKLFGKLSRLIALEAKKAGGSLQSPGLRAAIEKARAANMPRENIDRAVAKGKGEEGESFVPVQYETYGPGGCAIIITGLTENKNRTSAEVRHILSEHGSVLADEGSARWAFEKTEDGWTPSVTVSLSPDDHAALVTLTESLLSLDDVQDVYTNVS